MFNIIQSVLALILTVLNVFTYPVFGRFTGNTEPIDTENCKLSFAAISDIHMKDSIRAAMLGIGLNDMQNFSHELDALVCTGDLTDHGYKEEWDLLESAFSGFDPARNIILAQGNHDTWTEDEGYNLARDYFIEYNERIAGRKILL